MRYSLFLLVILVVVSCRKKEGFDQIAVIGHGGMGLERQNSLFHDNSREAVKLALSIQGCDGVEVDIQMASDGELWLYHDPDLSTLTNGVGCIPQKTSAEIEGLHYTTIQKENVIRLSELDASWFTGKQVFLDIRHLDHCSGTYLNVDDFIEAIENSELATLTNVQVYCILSNPNWIDTFLQSGLDVLYCTAGSTDHDKWLLLYPELDGIVAKNTEITKDQVNSIQGSGKKVFIFEMRSPKGIRKAMNKLPDGVITDDIRATLIEKY